MASNCRQLRKITTGRYRPEDDGADNGFLVTQQEVGDKIGAQRQWVSQSERNGIRKLWRATIDPLLRERMIEMFILKQRGLDV